MKLLAIDRFWAKVDPEPNTGCWIWIGARRRRDYGAFWTGEINGEPHRFIYIQEHGPLGDLELDHRCRNRWCVNPGHLEPVTHLENVRRGRAGINHRIKAACPLGHPYDRVIRKPNGLLRRLCGECVRRRGRESERLRRARRRAAN